MAKYEKELKRLERKIFIYRVGLAVYTFLLRAILYPLPLWILLALYYFGSS